MRKFWLGVLIAAMVLGAAGMASAARPTMDPGYVSMDLTEVDLEGELIQGDGSGTGGIELSELEEFVPAGSLDILGDVRILSVGYFDAPVTSVNSEDMTLTINNIPKAFSDLIDAVSGPKSSPKRSSSKAFSGLFDAASGEKPVVFVLRDNDGLFTLIKKAVGGEGDVDIEDSTTLNIYGNFDLPNTANYWVFLAISSAAQSKVATPSADPAAGKYTGAQSVTLACGTASADIYYTVDGTDPTVSSDKYTKAIDVNESMTIKAIAVKSGMTNSDILTAAYVLGGGGGGGGCMTGLGALALLAVVPVILRRKK